MLINYRFILIYNSVQEEVFPIYDDDVILRKEKKDGRKFAITELNGDLIFQGETFRTIKGLPIDTHFQLKVSTDTGTITDYVFESDFFRTDCEFDDDDEKVTFSVNSTSKKQRVIEGADKEFNLLKFSPEEVSVKLKLQPVFQLYREGSSKVTNILSGIYFESNATPQNATQLTNDSHFGFWGSHVLITGSGQGLPDVSGHYVNGTGGDWIRKDNAFKIVFIDLGANSTWEIQRVSDSVAVYTTTLDVNLSDAVFTSVSSTDTVETDVIVLYTRLLTNLEEVAGVPTTAIDGTVDITGQPSNYTRALPIGVPLGTPVYGTGLEDSIIFTDLNSVDPTDFGRFSEDAIHFADNYFVRPDSDEFIAPVDQSYWSKGSFWWEYTQTLRDFQDSASNEYTVIGYRASDVVNTLLKQIEPSVQHLEEPAYSDFFYGSNNPVRGAKKYPVIVPKTNILVNKYDEPARRANIKLNDVLTLFANFHKCSWIIDADKLIIEHELYFENGRSYDSPVIGSDLTKLLEAKTRKRWAFGQNKWKYGKQQMPEQLVFKWMDQGSDPFDGFPINIISNYVQKGNLKEYPIGMFSSDVDFSSVAPNDITKRGFFFLECEVVDGEFTVPFVDLETSTGEKWKVQNGHASFVYAHDKYHRHGLPALNVEINEKAEVASSIKRNRIQEVIFMQSAPAIDEERLVKTDLGTGEIKSFERNLSTQSLKMTVRHDTE